MKTHNLNVVVGGKGSCYQDEIMGKVRGPVEHDSTQLERASLLDLM